MGKQRSTPKRAPEPGSQRPVGRSTSTPLPQRAGVPKSASLTPDGPTANPLAPGMVVPSTRKRPHAPQRSAPAMAAPRAKKVVRPPDGHEFVYTVRCVHCGAHQEMSSLEQTYPSHLRRGRGKILCPWSNTRLSAHQVQEASRQAVKKPVAPTSTANTRRTAQKPDRSASRTTAKASSKKAKKPQTPPQRRGQAVSSTRSAKNSSVTDRGAAARERYGERRCYTSEYGDIGDDRFRERGELNADSVSVSARLGPSQGTGRRR